MTDLSIVFWIVLHVIYEPFYSYAPSLHFFFPSLLLSHTHTPTQTQTHTHKHSYAHTYTYKHIYTHTHAHTHTHSHIHIPALSCPLLSVISLSQSPLCNHSFTIHNNNMNIFLIIDTIIIIYHYICYHSYYSYHYISCQPF
jgi:hypothetical protein